MLRNSGRLILILICFCCVPYAGSEGNTAGTLTGIWEGGGRACYGKLVLKAKSVAWKTSFSSCAQTAYTRLEPVGSGSNVMVVALKHRNKGCLFSVITLSPNAKSGGQELWDVTGFATAQDYKTKNLENATMCGLFRISR